MQALVSECQSGNSLTIACAGGDGLQRCPGRLIVAARRDQRERQVQPVCQGRRWPARPRPAPAVRPSGPDLGPLMSHTSAWEILRALCGELAMQQAGGLADLDKVSPGCDTLVHTPGGGSRPGLVSCRTGLMRSRSRSSSPWARPADGTVRA
jgi:hypothetical protein